MVKVWAAHGLLTNVAKLRIAIRRNIGPINPFAPQITIPEIVKEEVVSEPLTK